MNAVRRTLSHSGVSRWLSYVLMFELMIACKPVASEAPTASTPSPPAAVASASVAGDVIVKFRDESQSGRVVAPILTGQSPIDSAASLASDLSSELGSPLSPVRVTSGRELVLAIDRERLGQIISRRAAGVSDIRSVKPGDASASLSAQQQLEFVVQSNPGSDVEKAMGEITGSFRPHARSRIEKDGQWVLSIDMAGLTRQTVEQLQKRGDVEYAQSNLILKHNPRPN